MLRVMEVPARRQVTSDGVQSREHLGNHCGFRVGKFTQPPVDELEQFCSSAHDVLSIWGDPCQYTPAILGVGLALDQTPFLEGVNRIGGGRRV